MNRFGISFLSKSRKAEALDEEVMIHKQTGEVLIKGAGGEILSYDKVGRLNDHINSVTNLCHTMNLLGKMYEVEFTVLDLPEVIPEAVNLLDSYAPLTTNKKISKLLVSIDIDSLKIVTPLVSMNANQPDVTINIILAVNSTQSTTYTMTHTFSLDKSNSFTFIPEYPAETLGDVVDYTVQLASIIVDRSSSDLVGDNLRYILHNVISVVKEVV